LPAVARGTLIYVIRHGHGGPSLVAHAYLEGTSEVYPNIEQNEDVALRPPAES
jgi:phosphoketolase